jgi:hypothetical protein
MPSRSQHPSWTDPKPHPTWNRCPRRGTRRWFWLAGCLLVAALFGFRAANEPSLESAIDQSSPAPAVTGVPTKPIAQIEVGERVVAEAPEGLAWDSEFGEPEVAGMAVGVSPDNPVTARCHGATPAAT